MEFSPIICEVQDGLPGSGEDGSTIAGAQRGKLPLCRVADVNHVAELEMHVVEQVSDEPFRRCSRIRRGFGRSSFARGLLRGLTCPGAQIAGMFYLKPRDGLQLATIEDLKILFTQIADGMTLRIANHSAYHHQLHIDLKGCRLVVS